MAHRFRRHDVTVSGRVLDIDMPPSETERKTGDQLAALIKFPRDDNKAIKTEREIMETARPTLTPSPHIMHTKHSKISSG